MGNMEALESTFWVSVLIQSLPSCVTLGESLNCSNFNFLIHKIEIFAVSISKCTFVCFLIYLFILNFILFL